MLIKSKGSRAVGSVGRILEYISRNSATVKDLKGKPYVICHNISGNSVQEFLEAFAQNERNRKVTRKGLRAFHEYMAWHPEDAANITPDMIKDMVETYLDMRAEKGMGVSFIHGDTQHPHAHILLSSLEVVSGKSLRLSKEQFAQIQRSMQDYQRTKYPELNQSLINFELESKQHITDDELAMNKRGANSRKQELIAIMETVLEDATSRDDFYDKLLSLGIGIYERSGKIAGVDDARHYRWDTLSITPEKFQELDNREERFAMLTAPTNDAELEELMAARNEVNGPDVDGNHGKTGEEIANEQTF